MELKPNEHIATMRGHELLIVPYGIETRTGTRRWNPDRLLIVPYGIETQHCRNHRIVRKALLIVPYGIETLSRNDPSLADGLLIVPYGIETLVLSDL